MTRMVGGTFGVAALGALFQSLSKSRLSSDLSGIHLTATQHQHVVDGLGAGQAGHALGGLDPTTAGQVTRAMKDAFVHGLSGSLKLSTGVAAAGAVLAFVLIEPHLKARKAPQVETEAAAAAAAAASASPPDQRTTNVFLLKRPRTPPALPRASTALTDTV